MEQIFLPTTVQFHETDQENVGEIVITPCHQGYGTTLGNALRRVLLSSLPGAAVESIKIKGVQHEFSAIEGVQEDVIEIILNVKQLAVRSFSKQPVTLSLVKKGIGEVTAGDFEKNADIEIVSPNLKIATITNKDKTFEMEITIGSGRGYVPVAEKETRVLDLGTIAIDSLYTPIRDIGYNVEMTRVGDITDYERLTIRIETNGAITPREAISQATKILIDHFALILDAAGGADTLSDAPERTESAGEVSAEIEETAVREIKEPAETEAREEAVAVEPKPDAPKKRGRKKKE